MIKSNIIWTSKEVSEVLNVNDRYDWNATGVAIDSRQVVSGDLFIALKMQNSNGHDYVEEAFERGAVAAIVSEAVDGVDVSKLIVVEDSFQALKDLGVAARDRCGAKVISIISGFEEVGVKDLLAESLSAYGQTHTSMKSYGNDWGVPLSFARMHAGTDYAVFELEADYGGNVSNHSYMIESDICIIPKILDSSFESGLSEKTQINIFKFLSESGVVVLSSQNQNYNDLKEAAFGENIKMSICGDQDIYDSYISKHIEAANGSLVKTNILG
jgi:UDP-N-acetylmuramoyl-tripeptide--D-alanyl-D-alanine ligase